MSVIIGIDTHIVIRWDVARTADNRTRRGGHWSQRARVVKMAREAARLAWLNAGSPTASGKVRLSVICRRARQMDTCNIVGGLKPLIDGVFVNGMTPDDTPKHLELGSVTQETNKRWKGAEEVEFVIEQMRH